jgi:hypothetical protein
VKKRVLEFVKGRGEGEQKDEGEGMWLMDFITYMK